MQTFNTNAPFRLENGDVLEEVKLAFHTFGKLNSKKDNVVWVCHALTANSDVFSWWEGLFGEHKLFNPNDHFVVCVNVIGSCYGTTGPLSPRTNARPLFEKFPLLTTRDLANAHDLLRIHLKIERVKLLIGASLGGQQALEWAILQPDVFEQLVLIATNAKHSPYGIAFNESQRQAIYADPTFGQPKNGAGNTGLKVARSIAMLSYRSYEGYRRSQNDDEEKLENFNAASYQQYQGEKLAKRFNAYSYVLLSKVMDSHNVGRSRGSISSALAQIKAKTLVIGISSDQLFPLEEQKFLAAKINDADYHVIHSFYGHDGFLIETEQLKIALENFLRKRQVFFRPTAFKASLNDVERKTA